MQPRSKGCGEATLGAAHRAPEPPGEAPAQPLDGVEPFPTTVLRAGAQGGARTGTGVGVCRHPEGQRQGVQEQSGCQRPGKRWPASDELSTYACPYACPQGRRGLRPLGPGESVPGHPQNRMEFLRDPGPGRRQAPIHVAPPATRFTTGQETGPFRVRTLIGSNKSPAVWPELCPASPPRRSPHGPASPWPRATPPRPWPQNGCRSVWAGPRTPCCDGGLLGPEYSEAAGQGAGGFPRPGSGLPWRTKK